MLNKVQCLTPDGCRRRGAHQASALAMHTMRGARGDYIASAIRQKWAEGCDFRVDYGLIGFHTEAATSLAPRPPAAASRSARPVSTTTPTTTSTSTTTVRTT